MRGWLRNRQVEVEESSDQGGSSVAEAIEVVERAVVWERQKEE